MKHDKEVKAFLSKSGKEISLRYPRKEDVDVFLEYINTISAEDTYITFSGEKVSRKDEVNWLNGVLTKIEKGDMVHLSAYDGNKLVGVSDVTRRLEGKRRTAHIGEFGITIRREYREDGIGKELMSAILSLAAEKLSIKIVTLNVYDQNKRAQKLYKALGFVPYGVLPKAILYQGAYIDEVKMYKEIEPIPYGSRHEI